MTSAWDLKIKELKAQMDVLQKAKELLKPADGAAKPSKPKAAAHVEKNNISKSASKPLSHPPAGNGEHKKKEKKKD